MMRSSLKNRWLGVSLVLLALAPAALAQAPGDAAADFTLVDKNGAIIHLSDFLGTPVIVNSWATWCPFCIEEIPLFQDAHNGVNSDGEQVVFLLVNLDENFDVATAYIDTQVSTTLRTVYDATAEIKAENDGVEFDTTQNVLTRLYRVRGMPTTFFINGDGIIESVKIGPLSQGELATHLAGLGVAWQP